MTDFVFDASAILAIAFKEPGADKAITRMAGARVSAVNYSEACAKLVDKGFAAQEAFNWLEALRLDVIGFDKEDASQAASLRAATRMKRLSFADRACLALALSRDATAVTTDRAWATLDLPCAIELIR
ncbi:MAG: type II toxin-antitoxin system VapC family toxin [Mesorhizobium sp.]|nr:type II toxin-antitoxin system VapC family toxin [Mesorhizobium sp.]MBN9245690.1 type II toxin-antitoxin system VapC family toxin [Mesorhizobium sp.]